LQGSSADEAEIAAGIVDVVAPGREAVVIKVGFE